MPARSNNGEPPRARLRLARIILSFVAVVAALSGAYAWYALKRIDYFVARDVRGLATLASQIADDPSGKIDANVAKRLSAQSFLSVFDVVLLADTNGKVLYQTATSQTPPLPTLFASKNRDEPKPSTGVVITNLGALLEDHRWGPLTRVQVERLRGMSRRTDVHVMDEDYYLFTHPIRSGFIVGTLVSKRKLHLQALSISNSILLILFAVVILVLCWYPYLRITQLPPRAPLTAVSAILAAIGALGAAAVMTVFVSDAIVFRHLSSEADEQLQVYAKKLREDLRRDILRSVVLAEALKTSQTIDKPDKPVDWTIPAIWQQPYFREWFWVKKEGQPIAIHAAKGVVSHPPSSMSGRAFFKDAIRGDWRSIEEVKTAADGKQKESILHRYVVEIRHGIDDPEITIAVPTDNEYLFGVTVPFIHFIDPVVPPGFSFAVINESGTVIFHDEKHRALNENFFKETDDNRHLRAAMYTRRDTPVNGRYWGADHQLYVAPVPDTPWTVVAMRDESLLRTINTEAIALTALLLALYAVFYTLIFVLLALVRPSYRAPWLWPQADREQEYRETIVALFVECLAFSVSIMVMGPSEVITIAFAASVRALATAFILMNGATRDFRWRVGVAVSVAATIVWTVVVILGRVDPIVSDRFGSRILTVFLALLVAFPFLASVFPTPPPAVRKIVPVRKILRKYQFAGMAMLIVAAVLPAMAFFNTAIGLGVDAQVKYTQLCLADLLEKRIVLLERIKMREARIAFDCYAIDHILNSAWTLKPRADTPRPRDSTDHAARPPAEMNVGPYRLKPRIEPPGIPTFIQDMLPRYSDSSVAVRELHFDETSDQTWRWWRRPQDLTLERQIILDDATRKSLYSRDAAGSTTASIIVRSAIPPATLQDQLFARHYAPGTFARELQCPDLRDSDTGNVAARYPMTEEPRHWQPITGMIWLTALLMALALFQAVAFLGHRVFLFDVEEPPTAAGKVISVPGLNQFIEVDDATKPDFIDRTNLHPIDVKTAISSHTPWRTLLLAADAAHKSGILITGFEAAFGTEFSSASLLTLMEELIRMSRYSIVIESRISIPTALATQQGSMRERWQNVLDSFAHFSQRPASASGHPGRFEQIWSNSSREERLMLFQIARDGLANRKHSDVLRRLLARGLVKFNPELVLAIDKTEDEEFEKFVLQQGRREGISDEESPPTPPRWRWLRIGLASIAVGAIFLLLATQKDLLNSTSVVITALAAGIPAILQLVTFIGGRRPTRDLGS